MLVEGVTLRVLGMFGKGILSDFEFLFGELAPTVLGQNLDELF